MADWGCGPAGIPAIKLAFGTAYTLHAAAYIPIHRAWGVLGSSCEATAIRGAVL
jgi:hypothetical protein